MRLFSKLWNRVFGASPEKSPPAMPAVASVSIPVFAEELSAATTGARKPGRPLSHSMTKAMEVVAKRPDISAAELAKALKVSSSYARTLLRRARARSADSGPAVQPAALVAMPMPDASAVSASPKLETAVAEIATRLEETERILSALRSTPVQARANWNLNRRSEVVRLNSTGESAADIASRLAIPPGEVEFILKVDRMMA